MFNINQAAAGTLEDWSLLTTIYLTKRKDWVETPKLSPKPYFYFNPHNDLFRDQLGTSKRYDGWNKLTFLDIHSLISRDLNLFQSETQLKYSAKTLSNLTQVYQGMEEDLKHKLQSWRPLDILCRTIQKITNWFQGKGWVSRHQINLGLISNQQEQLEQASSTVEKARQEKINTIKSFLSLIEKDLTDLNKSVSLKDNDWAYKEITQEDRAEIKRIQIQLDTLKQSPDDYFSSALSLITQIQKQIQEMKGHY